MNRLAITRVELNRKNFIAYISLDEKRDFIDFKLYPDDKEHLVGAVYIGRVEHVVSNIQAAFVKISPTQKCFLPLSEVKYAIFTKKQSDKKAISEGDELLVQVTKDAMKTKDPVVSTKLTLTGKYCVLTTGNNTLSVSKKLPEDLRTTQKDLLKSLCPDHLEYNYGIVLRTNSVCANEQDLKEDIVSMVSEYKSILDKSKYLSAYTRMYEPVPEYLRHLQTIRNFSVSDSSLNASEGGYDGIYTDIPKIYEQVTYFLPYLAKQGIVHFYEDKMVSLATLYNIEGNVEKLLSRLVWLKSGANIIIEQLETLTFIDVNSSKNTTFSKRGQDAVNLLINKEAAIEAARQIRLRNISGMIIVDFINMENNESEEELISCLRKELQKDIVPCQFIDITKLGLVEITRKKISKSLKEIVDV